MGSLLLIYDKWLPKISNKIVHPYARWRLKKLAHRAFGGPDVPTSHYARTFARVRIVRVLGPHQKPMDTDNFSILVAGLRDALKPAYIVDDSPKWATFEYCNEGARRAKGPRIEVEITYES